MIRTAKKFPPFLCVYPHGVYADVGGELFQGPNDRWENDLSSVGGDSVYTAGAY